MHAALIINLPGQQKAIRETLEGLRAPNCALQVLGISAAMPYGVQLIGGPYVETHDARGRGLPAQSHTSYVLRCLPADERGLPAGQRASLV